MALAMLLFAGFIGLALATTLAVMSVLEFAFHAWDAAWRVRRDAGFAVQSASQPAVSAQVFSPSRVHQWAQSA